MKRRRFALVYRYVCSSRSFPARGSGGSLKSVSPTDGSRAHKEEPDEMKSSLTPRQKPTRPPLVPEHFEPKQTLCQTTVTMDISTRGISLLSLTPPYPVFASFHQRVSVRFPAVCVEVWPPVPNGAPAAAGTSPVLWECAGKRRTLCGSCLRRALRCSASSLWPLLLSRV